MRNLSFHLTTAQMRAKTKTVTRRRGTFWTRLKPGELVCAVEKSQGVKKGGLVRICVIRVVSVSTERLDVLRTSSAYGIDEARREGFPAMNGWGFVQMFMKHMKCEQDQIVTRIEFEFPACTCNHLDHDARAFGCEFCPCSYVPAVRT